MNSSISSSSRRERATLTRFAVEVSGFFAVQGVVLLGLWAAAPVDPDVYVGAAADKHARIRQAASPRVIFVGGSNAAFGFDSAFVADHTDRVPVNMGLHAGLGYAYMLDETAEHVREDDLVVVSLEYHHFAGLRPEPVLLELVETHPDALRYLEGAYAGWFTDLACEHVGRRAKKLIGSLTGRPVSRAPYLRDGFDDYGDVVRHHTMRPRAFSVSGERLEAIRPGTTRQLVDRLEGFAARVRARGAEVVYVHPPIPERTYALRRGPLDRVHQALSASTVDVLNEPTGYGVELFFDTIYHLSRDGKRQRTARLLEALDRWCAKRRGEPGCPG